MLWQKPVFELLELLKRKEVKPSEVVQAFYERFSQTEEKVKAYITPTYEQALQQAKELEGKNPEDYPLYGIPIAIKDNINVEGYPTTCASKILESYISPYDATVIERLKKAGALIVGKTNMDEFAMGSSTEYSAFFPTKNPWDLERVPGGSSGGSAVAVAVLSAPLVPWLGHGRFHQTARQLLRCDRAKAHLRKGLSLWACSLCLLLGPDRSLWKENKGCSPFDGNH
jgi:aspartyl-tRNA(Asn)/glutamyl-tRNA(Gln) amidotransferase subunit A